jgi:DNA-binding transcriptional ArsR family regulator
VFAYKLRTLPPSATFVFYVLDKKGPLRRYQLLTETMLSDRTLGYALEKLLDEGLVKKTIDEKDARMRVYQIINCPMDFYKMT